MLFAQVNPNVDVGQLINLAGILLSAGALYGGISARLREGERRMVAIEKTVSEFGQQMTSILIDHGTVAGHGEEIMRCRNRLHAIEPALRSLQSELADMQSNVSRLESSVSTLQSDRWKHGAG